MMEIWNEGMMEGCNDEMMANNGWKLVEMAGMPGNDWKLLKIAENGWKWLK